MHALSATSLHRVAHIRHTKLRHVLQRNFRHIKHWIDVGVEEIGGTPAMCGKGLTPGCMQGCGAHANDLLEMHIHSSGSDE